MAALDSIDNAWSLIAETLSPVAQGEICVLSQPTPTPALIRLLKTFPKTNIELVHSFAPAVEEFASHGLVSSPTASERACDKFIFVPTRQRTESLGLIARALLRLKPEGDFVFACPNDLGAKGFLTQLKEIFPDLEAESGKKCRYFTRKASSVENREILAGWIRDAENSQVPGTNYHTVSGIYGWNKIDRASELLVSTLPSLSGNGADLGSGYGFLSERALVRNPEITRVTLVEADARALECARRNLSPYTDRCEYLWRNVVATGALAGLQDLDWVIMNPPFHESSDPEPEIGSKFILAALRMLKHGGTLYMVANAFLSYEKTLSANFKTSERVLEAEGFKVIHARR